MTKLSILGGTPVRNKPYPLHSTLIGEEEVAAVVKVLETEHLSGFSARPGERFLGGTSVRNFEESLCKFFEVKNSVTFNSATSALHAAVYSSKASKGDEVITSPFTMSATGSSILMNNATPVFCDIEDQTFGLDPLKLKNLINERTKAVLAVNIFGHGASLDELRKICDEYGLVLIEDSAQAPLINYKDKLCGKFGDVGVFSLNYHKAIQTGEGGVAISEKQELVDRMRFLRNHGEAVIGPADRLDMIDMIGFNYRMTEIEAAIGNIQLKRLKKLNNIRLDLAKKLIYKLEAFDFLDTPKIKEDCGHGFYLFPMKYKEEEINLPREIFVKAMNAEGISLGFGYVLPLHLQPFFQLHSQENYAGYEGYGLGAFKKEYSKDWKKNNLLNKSVDYRKGTCPIAEDMHFKKILTTDICKFPNTENEVEEMVKAIEKILKNIKELRKLSR
tara:strand:- start:828 stop:2162 length:1335 start_codon:yes stop_codon:yes gene_type:complete